MKKLITICAVLCLMLISTSVSWASVVTPPPGAPSWWNSETGLYAYGYWSRDIIAAGSAALVCILCGEIVRVCVAGNIDVSGTVQGYAIAFV